MSDCIFCSIIEGDIPSKKIYEDERVLAFHDISPQAKVHVLVISKAHIPSSASLTASDEALCGHMVLTAVRLAKELDIADDGYRMVINTGGAAGQTVEHLHLHLIGGEKLSGRMA